MEILKRMVALLTLTAMVASPAHYLFADQYVHVPGDYLRAPGEYGRSPGDYANTPSEYVRTPGEYGRSPGDYADFPVEENRASNNEDNRPYTNYETPKSGSSPSSYTNVPNETTSEYNQTPNQNANTNGNVNASAPAMSPGEHVPHIPASSECFNEFNAASGEYISPSAQYVSTTGGCGYEECRGIPYLIPLITFSAIAIAVIIVVALQQSSGSSGHSDNR